jgi:hypothetical protein
LLEKFEKKQRRKEVDPFDGIFNLGELNKEENIRQLLR